MIWREKRREEGEGEEEGGGGKSGEEKCRECECRVYGEGEEGGRKARREVEEKMKMGGSER